MQELHILANPPSSNTSQRKLLCFLFCSACSTTSLLRAYDKENYTTFADIFPNLEMELDDKIPSSKAILGFLSNKNNFKPDIESHVDKSILIKRKKNV